MSLEISNSNLQAEAITVSVVITTFNHARFLGEAISSVLAQTRRAEAIVVVDDGSTDNPAGVVAEFQGVSLITQSNRGLSAARNAGLKCCTTSHMVFLDADDRLLPHALEAGIACAAARPDCAFVYGGHRRIFEDGTPQGADRYNDIGSAPYLSLLQGNLIGMHATVLYRRDRLLEIHGFDEALPRCEDYDLYLRLAANHPLASHAATIAEYRWHGQNMSRNPDQMLRSMLEVFHRHETTMGDNPAAHTAIQKGRRAIRDYYAAELIALARVHWKSCRGVSPVVEALVRSAVWSPRIFVCAIAGSVHHRITAMLSIPRIERRLRSKRNFSPDHRPD